jgi:hypothetical protein
MVAVFNLLQIYRNMQMINMCVDIREYTPMSRPRPKVLLEITNKKNYKTEQVLESEAIWAVFYQDRPINLKTTSLVALNQLGPKYKKVSFSNSGHAFNLAEKLNKIFNTTDFSVYKLFSGVRVEDESKK